MSFRQLSIFRSILELEDILPSKNGVNEKQQEINNKLEVELGIERTYIEKGEVNGAKVSNPDKMLTLFMNAQQRDHKSQTTVLKLRGDGRQFHIGNVGYWLCPLNGPQIKSQSSSDFLPLLVYSGKDNLKTL